MIAAAVAFVVKHVVLVLLLSIGLHTTPHVLRATWTERAMIGRALLVVLVGVPLLAVVITKLLPLTEDAAAFISLMAACAGAPLVLRRFRNRASLVAIIAIVSLLAPFTVTVWVLALDRLFVPHLVASTPALFETGLEQVIALGIGVAVAAVAPDLARRLSRISWYVFLACFALAVALVLVKGAPGLLLVRPMAIVAVVIVTLGAALLGHLAGGPHDDDRRMLATTAALGNPALAFGVIASTFPGFRPGAIVLAFLIVRALALVPYTVWSRHRAPAVHGGAAPA